MLSTHASLMPFDQALEVHNHVILFRASLAIADVYRMKTDSLSVTDKVRLPTTVLDNSQVAFAASLVVPFLCSFNLP